MFGILKRSGKVYTVPLDNLKADTLIPIIQEKVVPDSIVYSDGFKSYDVLDVSEFKHEWGRVPHANERVDHSKELVDQQDKGRQINGIENFWNQAKRVLRKYNGIPRQHFHLFIKECEFRFNYGSPSQQLKTPNAGSERRGVF